MTTLWLLWRTNVGKSTLFNKLLGTHRAIVTDISWTTKELLVDNTDINWRKVQLIDSPWLDSFEEEVDDFRVQEMIINAWMQDKTILVVNKLDGKVFSDEVYTLLAEWYALWFTHVMPTSAIQASNYR